MFLLFWTISNIWILQCIHCRLTKVNKLKITPDNHCIKMVSKKTKIRKLTREHIVKVGDLLFSFDEVDSAVIEVNFKDGSSIAYESESKKIINSLSGSEN